MRVRTKNWSCMISCIKSVMQHKHESVPKEIHRHAFKHTHTLTPTDGKDIAQLPDCVFRKANSL